MILPEDSAERKKHPIYSGVLAYFPDAMVALARLSWEGNEKHNPGEPLHWSRHKSPDHKDCLVRHLMEGDYTAMAWRALAILQLHLEQTKR